MNASSHSSVDDGEVVSSIAEILNTSPSSVEILPGGVEDWVQAEAANAKPFIFVEGNLGIPQKLLYRLYLFILPVFNQARRSFKSALLHRQTRMLLDSSSIILLANPAHQTALHIRKRLVAAGELPFEQEMVFSRLLLGSSREASKQSIIWDHRRWLLQYRYPPTTYESDISLSDVPGWTRRQNFMFSSVPAGILREELAILSQCCELYPRNYYAWNHWHFCVVTAYHCGLVANAEDRGHRDLITQSFSQLLQWVDRHVSDYTAVHHLCNLVQRFQSGPLLLDLQMDVESLAEHALSLATKYPEHETLWMYVRAVWDLTKGDLKDRMSVRIQSLPSCQYRERCINWESARN